MSFSNLLYPFTFIAILQYAPQEPGIIVLYGPQGKILYAASTTTGTIKGALLTLLENSPNTYYEQTTHFRTAVKISI